MIRIASLGALALALAAALASPAASAQLPPRIVSAKDGAAMVLVPAGRFRSGITPAELRRKVRELNERVVSFYETELPRADRTLPDFYVDVTEVTNAQYERFVRETRRAPGRFASTRTFGRAGQPVVGVGWPDAEAYCAWAGERLPTELEWEKAARGTDGRTFPWGDQASPSWFNGRATGLRAPTEVGQYPRGASRWGALDMAGNVWEMTSSRWPRDTSEAHAMKGGSFLNTNADVRTTVRWSAEDEAAGATWLGFRCVADAAAAAAIARP